MNKIILLEWLLLPRELKQQSRINIRSLKIKPNLVKKNLSTTNKKKKTTFNIDFNTVDYLILMKKNIFGLIF
jgi:hypothetical protein